MKRLFLFILLNLFTSQAYTQDGRCLFGNQILPNGSSLNIQSDPDLDGKLQGAADFLFVVDESAAMIREHAYLQKLAPLLDSKLQERGVGVTENGARNLFCLVRYASRDNLGGKVVVSGVDANEFTVGMSQLIRDGTTQVQDGYSAMKVAIDNCDFRPETAHILVLITDQDRDIVDQSVTRNSILSLLTRHNFVLDTIVEARFGFDGLLDGPYAIGMSHLGGGYYGDNSGECQEVPYSIVSFPHPSELSNQIPAFNTNSVFH